MRLAPPFVFLAALALFGARPARALGPPDFSGHWKMDAARSRFGSQPKPESMTLVVGHREPQLEETMSLGGPGGEDTSRMLFRTDGFETVNAFQGTKVRSRARWEGQALILESRPPSEGKEVVFWNRWRMSADASVLTVEIKIVGGPEGSAQEIVFRREAVDP